MVALSSRKYCGDVVEAGVERCGVKAEDCFLVEGGKSSANCGEVAASNF